MRRKERVTANVLDVVIQIISLAIVQSHLATKIKRPLLEVLGAIARMTPKTKPTTKLVSWLNRLMRDLLEKEILELNEKIKKLERSKEIEIACKSCDELKLENAKLKETQVKFVKFDKSANTLREMLDNQKSSSCKIGLGFDNSKASTSGTKIMSFVGSSAENATDGSTIRGHGSTIPGSVCLRTCLEPDEWIKDSGCSKHMTGNKSLFSTYKAYDGGNVVFGSNLKGKIIGKWNKSQDKLCLATVVDNSTLWHRRLGHANMRLIQSFSSKELVRNLPKLKYNKHFCDACKIGKQAHASHKAKNMVSTKRCLELLHMDLFGPSAIKSYGGNLYTLVVVDDYFRYTWTRFLKTKNEAFEKFEILSRKIKNQLGSSIIAIRTDHGREFDNEVQFGAYCDAQGITHNFSAPRTPQSNGVVERKNRTLQEMSRTMLNEQSIPQKFWCNVVGYSQNSKAYVVLNKHSMKVEESLNVTFDESPPPNKLSPLVDDDVGKEEAIKTNTKAVNNINEEDESIEVDEIVNIKESKNHPLDQVIENLNQRTLRSQA
ncbi:retrovirus-related pol polyprotein from transposon TNT 1-94 [Tanacetum coccineum]